MTSIFTQYEYEHWIEGLYGEYKRDVEERLRTGRFAEPYDPRGVSYYILNLMRELDKDYLYYIGKSVYEPRRRITAILNPRCILFDFLNTHVEWLLSPRAKNVDKTEEEMIGILFEVYLNALSRMRDGVAFFDAKEAAWDFRDVLTSWNKSKQWRKAMSEVYRRLKTAVREVERFFYKFEADLNQNGAKEFSWQTGQVRNGAAHEGVHEVYWDLGEIAHSVNKREREALLAKFRIEQKRCKVDETDVCGLSAWTRIVGDLNLPDPMKPFEREIENVSGLFDVLGWNIGIDYRAKKNRKPINVREYPDKSMFDKYIAVVAPLRQRVELNFEYCRRMGMFDLQERWASPKLHLYGFMEGIWPMELSRAEEFFHEFKAVTERTVREMRSRKLSWHSVEHPVKGKGISRFAGRAIRKLCVRDDGVTFVVFGTLYKITSAQALSLLDRLIESYESGDGWVDCKGHAPSSYFRRGLAKQFRTKFIHVNGDRARLEIR